MFFLKCGSNEAILDLLIDDDADTKFEGLRNYISETSPDSTVNSYLNQGEYEITSVETVDIRSMNWKEEL